jgi:phosphocarrier protein
MNKVKKEIIVKNKQGLHARPAALFVQIANKFDAEISVCKDNEQVNGKSIMGILLLGAERDSKVTIIAEGNDAEQAVVELEKLLTQEND